LVYKGSFSLLDTVPQIVPIPYDSAVQMTPESPNYLCEQTGSVDGYLLWEKDGEVYTAIEENGVVQNIINLSNSPNPSIHPNLSIFGDSLYAVWQEEFPFGNKIFFTKRSAGLNNNWETPIELILFPDSVEYPVCYGPFIIASGKTPEGNYDIYGLRTDEFGDVGYIFQMTGTKSKSKFPAVCYSQHFPKQKLYTLWTEDTTMIRGVPAVGPVKCKVEAMAPPIPKIAANLGSPDTSPYTVQREGYKVFGNLAFHKIDYHPRKLIYHFSGLNPSKRYKVKLVFYYRTEELALKKWQFKVKVGGHPIGSVIVRPDEPTYFEKWVPISAYGSGNMNVSIEKKKGDYALCSEIFLYEYEKTHGRGGTQFAENQYNLPQQIQFITPKPNPFNSSARVGFVISAKQKVTLRIYDISGRLCKTLVDKKLDAGTYNYNWSGRDENGEKLSSGVYFSVLNAIDKRFVKKMVKIK